MNDCNDITLRKSSQAAVDTPIAVTMFPDQRAFKKNERSISLTELEGIIRNSHGQDKASLPWFKLASFGNHKTDKGCLRNNDNVLSVTGLEADYDAGQITVRQAAARLQKAGIAALVYSTPSSTAEHPRWRVFTPFARERDPERRTEYMEQLNHVFDGMLDGASFTLSQAYYGGNVEGRDPIQTRLVDGDFIDRCKDLPRLPKGKRPTEHGQENAPDESGSGELFRLAREIKDSRGGTIEDFKAAIPDHRAAAAHVKRNGERAITRAWERAPDIRDEFEDLPPLERVKPIKLMCSKSGIPYSNLANAVTLLSSSESLLDMLAYNEMTQSTVLKRTVPIHKGNAGKPIEQRAISDADVVAIQEFMQRAGLINISINTVHDAVSKIAHEYSFHPVRDWLRCLTWDGERRLDSWLTDYLGSPDSEYVRRVGRMFLIQMVARVSRAGCKADYMMVLEGQQGVGKSSACAILAGDYFSDSLPDLSTGKEAMAHLSGNWLIEVGEMSALRKAEVEEIKHFITKTSDTYRPPYGRLEITQKRQCVFIGTTNADSYLRDETGGRRFWPIQCGKVHFQGLAANRAQLFAEAFVAFSHGEKWWPDADFEAKHIAPEQESRFEADVWQEQIAIYLNREHEPIERVTVRELAVDVLNFDIERVGLPQQRRIVAVLKRLGWSLYRSHGAQQYVRTPIVVKRKGLRR